MAAKELLSSEFKDSVIASRLKSGEDHKRYRFLAYFIQPKSGEDFTSP